MHVQRSQSPAPTAMLDPGSRAIVYAGIRFAGMWFLDNQPLLVSIGHAATVFAMDLNSFIIPPLARDAAQILSAPAWSLVFDTDFPAYSTLGCVVQVGLRRYFHIE